MPHVLIYRVVLYACHMMLWLWCTSWITFISTFVIIIVVIAALIGEVCWPFVFVCTAIVLKSTYDLIDVVRRILVQFLVMTEDDDSDVDLT